MKYLVERDEYGNNKLSDESNELVKVIGDYFKEKFNLEKVPTFDFLVKFLIKNYLKTNKSKIVIEKE